MGTDFKLFLCVLCRGAKTTVTFACSSCCFVHVQVFPDAVVSQTLSPSHLLRSTLTIPYSSHNHSGTYHCNIIDGTSETETLTDRQLGLCEVQCFPFVTVSNPATITVLGKWPIVHILEKTHQSVLLVYVYHIHKTHHREFNKWRSSVGQVFICGSGVWVSTAYTGSQTTTAMEMEWNHSWWIFKCNTWHISSFHVCLDKPPKEIQCHFLCTLD